MRVSCSKALCGASAHPTPVQPTATPAAKRTRLVIALLVAGVGVVWALQGLGLIPGSFMSGDPTWAVLGAALIAAAVAYAAWPRIRGT
jgi:hypothetical protein